MASSEKPAIFRLPEELLLLVALQLPDSGTPQHLKNLALVSRTLRPSAQEALHAIAKLTVTCGCHLKVNAVVKLLRTLFDRPDLATKVRQLRFRAVRKDIGEFYEGQGFDLPSLRTRCLRRLQELGHVKSHPWWRSIENSIESAFAGLLLVQLPNLTHADFWVKDHLHGPPSSECITGLFGNTCPPAILAHNWRGIGHLTLGDTNMLKCGLELPSLTSLDLKTVSLGTLLRLNGSGCLQGTQNLRKLALTCSIQFADRILVEKANVQLGDIIDALGCLQLSELTILLINDGIHIGDALLPQLDTGYFMDQLCKVEETLEILAINLDISDDESELESLLNMCRNPKESLKNFTSLKRLIMPEVFLYAMGTGFLDSTCRPRDLPATLISLELLFPSKFVQGWLHDLFTMELNEDSAPPNLREIVLTCRDDVGEPSSHFNGLVNRLWPDLSNAFGIESIIHNQHDGTRDNLAKLYYDQDPTNSGLDSSDNEDDYMQNLVDSTA